MTKRDILVTKNHCLFYPLKKYVKKKDSQNYIEILNDEYYDITIEVDRDGKILEVFKGISGNLKKETTYFNPIILKIESETSITAKKIKIIISTARPGVVIGKKCAGRRRSVCSVSKTTITRHSGDVSRLIDAANPAVAGIGYV